MNWIAVATSLRLAALTTAMLLLLGLPLAHWLVFSRRRWVFLVEAVVALPLVLPPTVLGFYLLLALGPHGPLGKIAQASLGHSLAFTFEGLLLASTLYSLPFAVQPLTTKIVCGWIIGAVIQFTVAGAIIGAIYKPGARTT